MGPFSVADRSDAVWLRDDFVPGFAAVVEDVVIALEDAVGEPVVAHELPEVLDRVELGRPGRERHQGDIVGDFEHRGGMPSRLIEHDEGMGSGFDDPGDLSEMGVQRVGVGPGHDKAGGLAFRRADGAEDIGRGRSLVLGRSRARAAFGPPPGDLVLLPDAGLVLPPDFDLDTVTEPGADLLQAFGELFLNASMASRSWA